MDRALSLSRLICANISAESPKTVMSGTPILQQLEVAGLKWWHMM